MLLSELNLSKLTLGTVQLGMPYGVANTSGMPDSDTAERIISFAFDSGITTFDTAAAYGVSEQVVGRAISHLNIRDRVTVVTKVPSIPADTPPSQARHLFETSVHQSIKLLGIDPLPLVLLHNETNLPFIEELQTLVDRSMVKHAGISVQYTDWAEKAIQNPVVHAIQWPGSILDTRFEKLGFYTRAQNRCAIFLRSVYLQGLLVMSDDNTPKHLQCIIPVRKKLQQIAESAGIDIQQMALRYALGIKGCSSVVLGVESVRQLKENVDAAKKGPLPADVVSAIKDAVPELTEDILLPVNWPKISKQ